MRRLAVGWVWTNDPTVPVVTARKMLPLLGVGSWFLVAVLQPAFASRGVAIGRLVQKLWVNT